MSNNKNYVLKAELDNSLLFTGSKEECEKVLKAFTIYGIREDKFIIEEIKECSSCNKTEDLIVCPVCGFAICKDHVYSNECPDCETYIHDGIISYN